VKPSYQQIAFDSAEKKGRLRLLAAPAGGATTIHQDAKLYVSELGVKESVDHTLAPARHAWVQIVRGDVVLNGQTLNEGDGAAVTEESKLAFAGAGPEGGEFLLFDLA
jgi:redox-sensitive bicupin YhaK (pirin superfamily)